MSPPSRAPSTHMKRLYQQDEFCADFAPKKHKTQSYPKDSEKIKPSFSFGTGAHDSEGEDTDAMEIEEDELDNDIVFVETETPEEELERLQKDWNAPIYNFFQKKPIISVVNGRRCHEFICSAPICLKRGQNPRRVRRYLDKQDAKSTGNLHKHAVVCWGEEAVKRARSGSAKRPPQVMSAARESNRANGTIRNAIDCIGTDGRKKSACSNRPDTKAEIRLEAVRWVSESKHPFSIVQDHSFLRLMRAGRPHICVPSPLTVARDVQKVFASCQPRIAAMLQKYPGRLSFTTGVWTSLGNVPYMAVSVHLEEGGKPISLLLDFVEVSKSHTSLNLASEFVQTLRIFGVEKKLLAITCDDENNKDAMVTEMCDQIQESHDNQARIYCLTSVINLVVKSILNQFDSRKSRKGIHGVEIVDTECDKVKGRVEQPVCARASEPVYLILVKLRTIANSIKRSTTVLQSQWNKIVTEQGLPVRTMPHDETTRWTSTYDMLHFSLQYKSAIKILLNGEDELNDYQLIDSEWQLAQELCDVLKVFKEAILYASRDTTSVATIIPVLDHLYSLLSPRATSSRFSDNTITTLSPGMKTLERFHRKANMSKICRIATILNPCHKFRYFKQSGREEGWIEESRAMLETEWKTSYMNNSLPAESTSTRAGMASRTAWSDRHEQDQNIFNFCSFNHALISETADHDELQYYLSTSIEQVTDPIEWWNSNTRTFPRLSRMALDYLSIPATSNEVERIFREGRSLLSHTRSRLTPKSTHALMCLGEWSMSGFIKEADMLKALMEEDDLESEDENECQYEDEDLGTLFYD